MKSCDKSNALRVDGNEFYKQRKFFDALLKYNESLCFAEKGSVNAGHAFANRSAIYLEMRLYEECLQNIQLAFTHNYPQKNFEVLKKREEKCREMMRKCERKNSQSDEIFKLSHPQHKNLPSIVDCLELKFNKKFGRHIITNRSLSVGDVIAIDEPVFNVIKSDSRYDTCSNENIYQRCENCLSEKNLTLIPCDRCTRVMFCGVECKENAEKSHHHYECEIIDELLKSGIKHIVLRIFFEGLSYFDGDCNEMEKYLKENCEKNLNIFTIKSKGVEKKKEIFMATISLSSDDDNFNIDEYKKIFQKSKKLINLWKNHEKFLTKILKKLHSVGSKDVHGIGKWSLRKWEENVIKMPSEFQELIGNACYLFSSLINHSCAPNVRRLNFQNKIVLFCLRPIKPGDQLFDSYRQTFNVQPKEIRQENLMKDYGFKCDCEACTNNFPLNKDLKTFDESLLEYVWDSYDELQHLNQNEAKIRLQEFYKISNDFHRHFPSSELVVLQECISNALIAVTKPTVQFP